LVLASRIVVVMMGIGKVLEKVAVGAERTVGVTVWGLATESIPSKRASHAVLSFLIFVDWSSVRVVGSHLLLH